MKSNNIENELKALGVFGGDDLLKVVNDIADGKNLEKHTFVDPEYPGDSVHVIVKRGLKHGGELHHFTNGGGADYSAIYVDGVEQGSCERDREAGMLKWWREQKVAVK